MSRWLLIGRFLLSILLDPSDQITFLEAVVPLDAKSVEDLRELLG